jgi:putative membrane protein
MNITDKLALERTKLANWRTVLAYIRTGLSFLALGIAVFHFLKFIAWIILGIISIGLGGFFIIAGLMSYKAFNKKISDIQKEAEKKKQIRGDDT